MENSVCKVGYPNKRYPLWTYFFAVSNTRVRTFVCKHAAKICPWSLWGYVGDKKHGLLAFTFSTASQLGPLGKPLGQQPKMLKHTPPTTKTRTPTPHYSTCNLGLQTSCRSCCGCVFSSILKYLTAAIAALCTRLGPARPGAWNVWRSGLAIVCIWSYC